MGQDLGRAQLGPLSRVLQAVVKVSEGLMFPLERGASSKFVQTVGRFQFLAVVRLSPLAPRGCPLPK